MPFYLGVAESPSNTKSPGPRTISIPSGTLVHPAVWPQQTWAENWGLSPLFWGGELGPHPTPTSLPSGTLIHPVIWPQQIWVKNWEAVPILGVGPGPHLTQCGQVEAYLHAKFHIDPPNRLATIHHVTDRQTDSTDR